MNWQNCLTIIKHTLFRFDLFDSAKERCFNNSAYMRNISFFVIIAILLECNFVL